ncbi:MAG: tetratricopeptide repeat protein [Verrucomicrobia bacterium]|nr:tetratricopeptide repeat protein [Verrucomicrobiota bacterium]
MPPTRPPSSPPVAAVPPAGRPDPTESVTTAPPPRVEPEPTPTPEPPPTRTVALPARPEPTPTPPTPSVPADTASPAATPSPTEVAPPEPSPPAITLADSLRARVEAEARTAEAAADATAEKRSLLQRLNPLGWFGSGRDEESAVKTPTPIPPPAVSGDLAQAAGRTAPGPSPPGSPATGVTGAARQLLGPTPSASAPVPAFPRYAYGAPRAVASGNRAQAERTFAQGVVAQRSGRLGEAIEAYRSALQQDPSFFDAHYNLGVALQDRADWAGALTAYEQALALRPTDADARFNFALALQSSGYPQDAALEFGNLLASRPNYVDAHFAVANLYAQTLDQRDQAREHYQRVLQLQPDHPQAAAIRRWLSVNR